MAGVRPQQCRPTMEVGSAPAQATRAYQAPLKSPFRYVLKFKKQMIVHFPSSKNDSLRSLLAHRRPIS